MVSVSPESPPRPYANGNIRRPSERVMRRRRQVAAAGALATAIGIGAGLTAWRVNSDDSPGKGSRAPTQQPYVAQPGDRLWDIAEKIERNTDGVAGDDSLLPIVDDLQREVGDDGILNAHEQVMVPADADLNPDKPGAQLTNQDH